MKHTFLLALQRTNVKGHISTGIRKINSVSAVCNQILLLKTVMKKMKTGKYTIYSKVRSVPALDVRTIGVSRIKHGLGRRVNHGTNNNRI